MSNEKIKKKIEKKLRKHSYNDISVSVKENIVTLSGHTKKYDDYINIGLLTGKIKDVKGVINNIKYTDFKIPDKKKTVEKEINSSDVLIIGGGVIGCSIARELSRYKLKTVLVEKQDDVSCGATKANNAMVHSGIGETPGSLKQILCVKGHFLYEQKTKELNVPFKKCGMLIVLTRDSLSKLPIPNFLGRFISKNIIPAIVVRRGRKMGLPMKKINRDELLKLEPDITNDALVAISSPSYGVTSPYEYTIALAENAIQNKVEFYLNNEVLDIKKMSDGNFKVLTDKGFFKTKYIINAAGIFADEIADMIDDRFYTIHPRKGSTLLFDKEIIGDISHILSILTFPRQKHTKGGGVMMTTHGNIQWGPTAVETSDKYDKSVNADEINQIFETYQSLLPDFPKKSIITYFAGIRAPTFTEDFIIQPSKKHSNFIHVAGIQSPGLAAAPAIADMVIDILCKQGLKLVNKKDFNPVRPRPIILNELSYEKRNSLIKKNPSYGRIVCRCEHVSEGEIVDAINSLLPATSIDAVKRRTRAGMGRCQSGFCLPRVAEIISRETNITIEDVLKNSEGSNLFVGKAKCLLECEL